jgi:hypothetical protein
MECKKMQGMENIKLKHKYMYTNIIFYTILCTLTASVV